jgi:hypothetical protein
MAFKPIIIEKEIKGQVFKAQFNGFSALLDAQAETNGDNKKSAEYIFKNVIVEPRIDDIDEFFGTDLNLFTEVLSFGGDVMSADKKYFPDPAEKEAKGTGRK